MPDPLYPPWLNAHPLPGLGTPHPPQIQTVTIHDLIQLRLAFDSLKFKSNLTQESIGHLDRVIHTFTSSINPGTPQS